MIWFIFHTWDTAMQFLCHALFSCMMRYVLDLCVIRYVPVSECCSLVFRFSLSSCLLSSSLSGSLSLALSVSVCCSLCVDLNNAQFWVCRHNTLLLYSQEVEDHMFSTCLYTFTVINTCMNCCGGGRGRRGSGAGAAHKWVG